MSQTGQTNGSLPRWVESLDRRLEQGLASCSQEIKGLREDVSAMAEGLGARIGELEQWRKSAAAPRRILSADWRSFLRTPWPWLVLLAALLIPGAIGQLIELVQVIRGG